MVELCIPSTWRKVNRKKSRGLFDSASCRPLFQWNWPHKYKSKSKGAVSEVTRNCFGFIDLALWLVKKTRPMYMYVLIKPMRCKVCNSAWPVLLKASIGTDGCLFYCHKVIVSGYLSLTLQPHNLFLETNGLGYKYDRVNVWVSD